MAEQISIGQVKRDISELVNRVAFKYDSFYLVVAEALQTDFWTADKRLVCSFQGAQPAWMHSIDDLS